MTEEQSYALLEYVIHLIAKDYPATLEDLIILGFISPEVGDDPEKVALVVPLLAKVCSLLLAPLLLDAECQVPSPVSAQKGSCLDVVLMYPPWWKMENGHRRFPEDVSVGARPVRFERGGAGQGGLVDMKFSIQPTT